LIFFSISIILLASLVAGTRPIVMLVQNIKECTPPYLSTGISNLLHTVPKAAQISEKYLGVYMGASPLAGKFPKAV
jgi:hypothetical protein